MHTYTIHTIMHTAHKQLKVHRQTARVLCTRQSSVLKMRHTQSSRRHHRHLRQPTRPGFFVKTAEANHASHTK
jgi:hypothetical protein